MYQRDIRLFVVETVAALETLASRFASRARIILAL